MPKFLFSTSLVLFLVAAGSRAGAQEVAQPALETAPIAQVAVPAPADVVSDAAMGATAAPASNLSSDELADLSGGDNSIALAVTNQNLQAVNSGNRIDAAGSVVTGAIDLTASAFSNFNGLGNIIMNTGNNNNIQSTLSVSVVMPPR